MSTDLFIYEGDISLEWSLLFFFFFCSVLSQLELLYLRKIWGFHGGDYEECSLLGCGAV
jgi:hypothetical protein